MISGCAGCEGAGRVSIRGDTSISVSLDESGAGRLAICLVSTIMIGRKTRVVRQEKWTTVFRVV